MQPNTTLCSLLLGLVVITTVLGARTTSASSHAIANRAVDAPLSKYVSWTACGNNVDCANVTVPLDYKNATDKRTYTLAVARYKATDTQKRQGAVFLNPGGPGGSGTGQIYQQSTVFSTILKGQYDLIGFDPRGVNKSSPYVSCFPSAFDQQAFALASNGLSLELPSKAQVNVSDLSFPVVKHDLRRQIALHRAQIDNLAVRCRERTGDAIAFMGAEFFVRDMDYLSKLIEGEHKPINYWAVSYGTYIGQTLVKVLPPHRIGKVVLDGIINPEEWSGYPTRFHRLGLEDLDHVLQAFAQTCYDAKENCTLNTPRSTAPKFKFTSPAALLSAIDDALDALYLSPIPVPGLPSPGTALATPSTLRNNIFGHMYSINAWPDLAEVLSVVLYEGDWTQAIARTQISVNPDLKNVPDDGQYAANIIQCTDTKPYDSSRPPPSDDQLASDILDNLKPSIVGRLGDRFFAFSLCHAWEKAGLSPRKSRYSGGFDMKNGTLKTPVLLLSNTIDPVTPIRSALIGLERLGNNARLIQQTGGLGHTALGHTSFCTALAVRAYFVNGKVPSKAHSFCQVDQKPWQPWGGEVIPGNVKRSGVDGEDDDDEELRNAWVQAGKAWKHQGF